MIQQSTLPNPFVGLRPYQSNDSLYYFGRNEQTKTLLRLLHQHRFVAVVGSSGAGKSSLIRAGLVPQLEAGFLVQQRDQWLVATAKPGDAPLQNLVSNLLALTNDADHEKDSPNQRTEQLTAQIEEHGTQALVDVLEPQLAKSDCNLFILIDQFEELFRFGLEKGQTAKRQQAEQFVALLLSLSRKDRPIYVCLTMRSDFLGDCDAFYGLPEAINKSQFLVPRLTRGQRQEVISNPVNLAGAKIAPRLVDKLLNESIDTRDDLPILQHALMRTWDVWQESGGDGALDIEHYEKAHTIHHALDRHADEALKELDEEQKCITKTLFQALTTVDTSNRKIRRPIHLNDFLNMTSASKLKILSVIKYFCDKKRSFLILSSKLSEENPLIDISHESLIRQWMQLAQWVDEEHEDAELYRRLLATCLRYKAKKADLLQGVELNQSITFLNKITQQSIAEVWAKRYENKNHASNTYLEVSSFIKNSMIAHKQKLENEKIENEKQQTLLKEKADFDNLKKIMTERKARERLMRRFTYSMVFLVITLFLLLYYVYGQTQQLNIANEITLFALDETKKANNSAKKLALEANYNLSKVFEEKSSNSISLGDKLTREKAYSGNAYRNALLYALEAQLINIPSDKPSIHPLTLGRVSAIPASSLESELYQTPINYIRNIKLVAYSPNGKIIASNSGDSFIRLRSSKSGEIVRTINTQFGAIQKLIYGENNIIIVVGSEDNSIRLMDTQSGKVIKTLSGHIKKVTSIAYSSTNKVIAFGAEDNSIRLWDTQTGKILFILKGHQGKVNSLSFSPKEKLITSGSEDKTLRLWNFQSGELIRTLKGHSEAINTVSFSPDGKFISSGSSDMSIKLWSVEPNKTDQPFKTLNGHSDEIMKITYSPDGKLIASGSKDETIRFWNTKSGKNEKILNGQFVEVSTLSYSPDGMTIALGSQDGTIRFWSTVINENISSFNSNSGSIYSLTYNPTGRIGVAGSDYAIQIWLDSNKDLRKNMVRRKDLVGAYSLAYDPEGKFFASGHHNGSIFLWNASLGLIIKSIEGHSERVFTIAISPDGKTIASGSADNTVRLWDAYSGKLIETLKGHKGRVFALAYSPNGEVIASGSDDKTIRLWNTKSGEVINTLKGHSGWVRTLAYSPDGNTIASGSSDNTIRLWHSKTGESINIFRGHEESILTLAYSPDGKSIASGSSDHTIRLWNAETGHLINSHTGHTGSINTLVYNPRDKVLVSGSQDSSIRFWNFTDPVYRFVYDFDAFEVSAVLRYLWELELEGLTFKPMPLRRSQINGDKYNTAWLDETRKYHSLLDMPKEGESKMDQVVRWLEERCAYKEPKRYGCVPARLKEMAEADM